MRIFGRDALVAAKTALAEARAALRTSELSLRSIALAEFDGAISTKVENFLGSSYYTVPSAFRVLAKTHSEWRALESALAAERMAIAREAELPARCAVLTTVRTDTEVMAAEFGIVNREEAIEEVFAGN